MGRTKQVATDRAKDRTRTVYPVEIARGLYMQHPPSLAALKLLHILIAKAGPAMAEDVPHQIALSEIRAIEGMRQHKRTTLRPLFQELAAAVLVTGGGGDDDPWHIGGLLDEADTAAFDASGGVLITWTFRRSFIRMAAASEHWALVDYQVALRLRSKFSMLLFLHVSSLVRLDHVAEKRFTVEELRAVLGVADGKLPMFKNLNTWALKPAIEEINAESRIQLTATTEMAGKWAKAVTIAWTLKPDPIRKSPRLVAPADAAPRAFPAAGGIGYAPAWQAIKRAAGCNADDQKIAADFRRWCQAKGVALDAGRITAIFADYCKRVGRI